MRLKLITPPAAEPILLADVHAQMGIPTADVSQDAVITRRIAEAREWAEVYCNRAFISQTLELAMDDFPAEIALPRGPVTTITSVKYMDVNQVEQTLDAATYTLDDYGVQPYLAPSYLADWPSVLQDYRNAVKIRYVAGYGATGASVPGPIREALLLTVGHWMNFQTGLESGASITRIPYAVECLLAPYRLYSFG